ncbi:MAG: divalent-cation tolerance protein CutA [Deltaproteobacteria bacterium]|jgi:periplasmic divalent cation tolerance protein|nr:divalent-cation tolerance protein CutA [Deltaproteobacteria bacterium]
MYLMVYITAADEDEAGRIARALVEERLAACVNILGRIESVYHWEGAVQASAEIALLAKTTEACFDALAARVRELHSYELPCVVAVPLARGEAAFLAWIGENVQRNPTCPST